MGMDDIGALRAYHAAQGRQFTQVTGDAFSGYAIADNLYATGLKSGHLLFDEWREATLFI